jgi:hypothetical protein
VATDQWRRGSVPLWNPYEAAGAPLAANMSSGVFDPLLLLVDLHSSALTWDITSLLILALNGVLTFVFARVIGLGDLLRLPRGSSTDYRASSSNHRTTRTSESTSTCR